MKKSQTLLPVFLLFLILAAVITFISWVAHIRGLALVQIVASPLQKSAIHVSQSLHTSPKDQIMLENAQLKAQVAHEDELRRENQALRDQFTTTSSTPQDLLPANVVGMPSFLPGVSSPENIILDKGSQDRVEVGSVVIYKDSLIGIVTKTNSHFSQVLLLTNMQTSFTAKDSKTNAIGIIKGQGNGQMIIDNVVLASTLNVGDAIVTGGANDINGKGYPPGLVIGTITSVEKNPSNLFQKASVQSLIDITKLPLVFIAIIR